MAFVASAFATVITAPPAGTLKNYNRTGCCVVNDYDAGFYVAYQEGKVSIVFADDGKVYMQNPLMAMAYDTWVEGTLSEDGKIISIPMGQTLYHSEFYDIDVVLSWGSTSEGIINYDTWEVEVNYTADETVEAALFEIDGETITLLGSEGADELTAEDLAEFAATGLTAVWADNGAWVQTIEWNTVLTEIPAPKPAVPANPEAVDWRDAGNESGYSRFEFKIDPVDVDGNPLETEYITYSIFTDYDQIVTFGMDHYSWDFNEETTEVPYGQYSYNFSPYSVYFYRTNAEGYDPFFTWRIGIQVYYTVDGVRNASDIVYLEVFEQTDAQELNADKTVAGVRYFNMAGQEMAQPSGMTIQVTTYTDGTTSAVKVMK